MAYKRRSRSTRKVRRVSRKSRKVSRKSRSRKNRRGGANDAYVARLEGMNESLNQLIIDAKEEMAQGGGYDDRAIKVNIEMYEKQIERNNGVIHNVEKKAAE